MAMGTLAHDLRFGARVLLKQPGFTVAAVLTLAIGVGANSAIFSVVNAVLLRPLAFPEPDRLVRLYETVPAGSGAVSTPNLLDWRAQSASFERIAGYSTRDLNLEGGAHPERAFSAVVEPEFFEVLRTPARLGRVPGPDEDLPGNDRVLVLSDRLWREGFGADPGVLGRAVLLAGIPHAVIGVMPPSFEYPTRDTDLWVPLTDDEAQRRPERRGNHTLGVIARLKPGVTLDEARDEMATIARVLEHEYPEYQAARGVAIIPLLEELTGGIRPWLMLLLAAVVCVLLIACTNVANLLLARASTRRREIAIRAALGAGRGRIIRQLLTESVLLAVLGGVFGLLTAWLGLRALVAWASLYLPRAGEIALDWRAVAFTLSLSVLTGLLFGLAPALHLTGTGLQEALKGGGGAGGAPQGTLLRGALVIAETAVALVLLLGAGLLARTLVQALNTDPGLRPEGVLTFRLTLSDGTYVTPESNAAFYAEALRRAAALPGVEAAAAISHLPMQQFGVNGGLDVEGRAPFDPFRERPVEFRSVSPGYHAALGIPLVAGRYLADSDAAGAEPVAVVNEAFVRDVLGGEPAVGRRVKHNDQSVALVGVVGDVRQWRLWEPAAPEIYFPMAQRPQQSMSFLLRSGRDVASLEADARAAVAAIDPGIPVYRVQPLEEVIRDSASVRQFVVMLMSGFAAIAMLLAVIGVYSVMSYTVAQSTREIGVRMALGAQARDVLRLVMGHGLLLTAAGIAVGLLGALPLTRLLSSLLRNGVQPADPATFVGVTATLVAAAMLACYLPARRAVRVDPMVALRYE